MRSIYRHEHIALNIAKTRLMTATFPYYKLHDTDRCDLRQGLFTRLRSESRLVVSRAMNRPPRKRFTTSRRK